MKLEIVQVLDFGSHDTERVMLRAVADCNLHYYILTDTTYTDASHISNKLRHMHWFHNQDVKSGDEVILYTKKGIDSSASLTNGRTRYTKYWGLGNSVWNNTGDAALLFEINTWRTTKVR